jgi:hypothetical protein
VCEEVKVPLGLVVQRWRRYGQDRLYVRTFDGEEVGSVNLRTGERTLKRPELGDEMELVVSEYLAGEPVVPPLPAATEIESAPTGTKPPVKSSRRRTPRPAPVVDADLADRRPGEGVAARAEQLAARNPVASRLARVFGLRTPDWAWRVGAAGERKVGRRLDRLTRHGWRVLHSVPLGRGGGGDIDHLLIGPAGVFTVNTKTHRGKAVKVGHTVVFVGGAQTNYVVKARREAQRVAQALTAALGRPVPVTALIICTGQRSVRGWLRNVPFGVQVIPARWCRLWLRFPGRGLLTPGEVAELYALARQPGTYQRV